MATKSGRHIMKLFIFIAIALAFVMAFSPGLVTNLFKGIKQVKKVKEEGVAAKGPEQAPAQVKVKKVILGPFEDVMPVLGTIKGITQIDLRFEVSGVMNGFNFREGDLVYKGDVIATLDQKDAILKREYNKSKLVSAQAATKISEKKLEINKKLYDIGAIIISKYEESQLECESTRAQEESAKKEVEFAQQEIEKTVLKSPIDGVLGTRELEPGEFITSQNRIGSVFDISGVYVEAGVIEKDIQKVKLEQQVKVNVDAFPNMDFWGKVDNIPSFVEGKSRTVPVKVKLENPRTELKPGMFARANIYVYQVTNAVIIPSSAAFDSNGDGTLDAVFVIEEGNIARKRDIEVGYTSFDQVEVTSGLSEGESVVVETAKKLEDGVKVEVIETGEEVLGGG